MADKELSIGIKTTGDPSGVNAVTAAIDAQKAAAVSTADASVTGSNKATAAAYQHAAAIRAVTDAAGGRAWSLPSAGTSPATGQAPVSPGATAPASASPAISVPASFSAAAAGAAAAIAPKTDETADASERAAEGLDKVADAAGKITPDGPEALTDGLSKTGDAAEGAFAKFTGIDSLTDELGELADKAGDVFGKGGDGKQAADLEATAAAAKKAGEAQTEAAAAAGKAADESAQKQEKTASAYTEHIKKVTDAIKEKQAVITVAAEEEKGEQETISSAYSEHVQRVVDALKEKQAAASGSAEEGVKSTKDEAAEQEDAAESYSENVQKVLDALKAKKKAAQDAGDADDDAAKKAKKAADETGNFGQRAMTWAQFADDAQYGLKGIMNQIPQLVESLGLGAGVAGVAGIAIVAINQLIQNFDVLGDKGPEAARLTAEEIGKITTELAKSRNEAREAAEDWAKSFANSKKHEKAIEDIAKKYKDLSDEINRAADARRRLNIVTLEQSDAELALELSEIEVQRAEGKITDIDAARKSQQVRRDYSKAQFEFSKKQRAEEREDIKKTIAGLDGEYSERTVKYQELSNIAGKLLPEKDFKILERDKNVAASRLQEARKKVLETPETAPTGEFYNQGTGPEMSVQEIGPNPEYAKAVQKEKIAQEYARKTLDRYNEIKDAREAAGEKLQDKIKMDEELEKQKAKLEDIDKARKTAAALDSEILKTDKSEDLKFKTSTRVVNNQDRIQLIDLEKQRTQEAEQKAAEALTEKRRVEDEAADKRFDAMEKAEKAAEARKKAQPRARTKGAKATKGTKATQNARTKGAKGTKGPAAAKDASDSETSVAEMRKQHDERVAGERREEDKRRKLAKEEEARKKLLLSDPQAPVRDPAEWQGPTRDAFPSGPHSFPEPESTLKERRKAMEALDRVPASANKLPAAPDVPARPRQDSGTGTEELTGGIDRYIASKRTPSDRLGGGDPRINELQKANDALKDGATLEELKRMNAAFAAFAGTFLASRQRDQAVIKSCTDRIDAMTAQLKQGRK